MTYAHGGTYLLVVMAAMMALRVFARSRRPGRTRRSALPATPADGSSLVEGPRAPDSGGAQHGIAPGWMVDPSGRFDQRYWSGTEWTDHVTKAGVPGTDPPPGRGSSQG